jgi:hypothetical protein
MKKFALILLAAALACTMLAACTNNGSEQNPTPTPTPTSNDQSAFNSPADEILDQLISQTIDKKALANEELKDITCYDKPVDADSCQDILGLTPAEFAASIVSAVESKPEGSWFAHSIVLIECQDGVDVAALADQISKGTNPARFGCIKAEAIVVGYAGQYILLCASFQNTCDALYTTFSDLSALPPSRIDRENDWNGGGMLGLGY